MLTIAAKGSPRGFRKIMSVSLVLGLAALTLCPLFVSSSDSNGARRLMSLRGEMTDVNAETLELIALLPPADQEEARVLLKAGELTDLFDDDYEDEARELLDYEDAARELITGQQKQDRHVKNNEDRRNHDLQDMLGRQPTDAEIEGKSFNGHRLTMRDLRRSQRAMARMLLRLTPEQRKIRTAKITKARHYKDLAIVLGRNPTEAEVRHSEEVGHHAALQEIRRKEVQEATRREMHRADLLAALGRDPTDEELDSSLKVGHSETMRGIRRRGGNLANDSHAEKRWRSPSYTNLRTALRQKRQAARKVRREN